MAETSAGLLFRIKGENDDAIRALKQTEAETSALTGTTAGLTSGLSALAAPAAIAGIAIAGIGAAALNAARTIFDLSKAASEFGSTIFDASQKTGLSAERLSAMKFAADQSGASLEQVTAGAARFAKNIGDAANGSDEAQKKLSRLGVTSYDLDKALGQALATIAKMPPGTAQMTAAMDAFGKSGADLLPFINSFDGDLEALTQKAKELGVTITDDAARASDEFGDQLDTLNAQFDSLGRTIGFAFMPIFNDMASSLSNFFTENHEAIERFATNASDIVRGFIVTLQRLDQQTKETTNSSLAQWGIWAAGMYARIEPVTYLYVKLLSYMKQVGEESRGVKAQLGSNLGPAFYGSGVTPPKTGGGGGASRVKTTNIDRSDSQEKVNEDYIKNLKATLDRAQKLWEAQEQATLAFQKAQFAEGAILEADYAKKRVDYDNEVLVRKLVNLQKEQAERERLGMSTVEVENQINILRAKQGEEFENRRAEAADKEWKKKEERWAIEAQHDADKAIADQAAWEAQQQRSEQSVTQIGSILPGLTNPNADAEANPFYLWQQGWEDFFSTVQQDAPVMGSLFEDLGGMMQNAFTGLAQAIGSVVQQWVLYGKTGPAVMRQMLAAVLASVAAEAAVKAIMATAEGFYFLATHQYDSAANAFVAAGFYAAVAGVAAVAGRAVAGNSFNQQSQRATGGSTSSSSASRGGNQGEAYSPYGTEATVYEQGRNQPSPGIRVTVSDDSTWLGKMLKFQIETNAGVRDMIKGVAEG